MTVETFMSEVVSVLIVGGGDLYRIKGNLDKKQYHSILERRAKTSGKKLCGRGGLPYFKIMTLNTVRTCAKSI